MTNSSRIQLRWFAPIFALSMLLSFAVWSYAPTLAELLRLWNASDDYSAGQLVPLVATILVWHDRRALKQCTLTPCWSFGIGLLLTAEIIRVYGLLSTRTSLERYPIVLTIVGLVLTIAGWQVFRRLFWILLFLFLMFPLPGVVHNAVSGPLQRVATTGAVFFLEAGGVSVSQEGNVVVLNGETPLAVAEACSGLRMLMAFIIVAAFIAYMVRRPRWQKGVLLGSSIPVAVVCNILRIVATAMLMLYVSAEVAQKFFHDFAGYVMMPAAVMLLFAEIWLMDRIIVPEPAPAAPASGTKARTVAKAREARSRKVADYA